MRRTTWKSGPSGPRKVCGINVGFSPCGCCYFGRARFSAASSGRADSAHKLDPALPADGYFCSAVLSFWYDALRVPLLCAIGSSVG